MRIFTGPKSSIRREPSVFGNKCIAAEILLSWTCLDWCIMKKKYEIKKEVERNPPNTLDSLTLLVLYYVVHPPLGASCRQPSDRPTGRLHYDHHPSNFAISSTNCVSVAPSTKERFRLGQEQLDLFKNTIKIEIF